MTKFGWRDDRTAPLTTISGYAEFLEDNLAGPLTDDQRMFVTQIQEAESRIRHIVDDLLDFARMEAGTFRLSLEVTDLSERVREVRASLLPQTAVASGLRFRRKGERSAASCETPRAGLRRAAG